MAEKLTRPEQYKLVYNKGLSWADNLFVVRAMRNGLDTARYGISVNRRVGNAVTRNRVKRLLREVLRLAPLEPGWDVVVIARTAAAGADYAGVARSINNLLSRGRLLRAVGNAPPPARTTASGRM